MGCNAVGGINRVMSEILGAFRRGFAGVMTGTISGAIAVDVCIASAIVSSAVTFLGLPLFRRAGISGSTISTSFSVAFSGVK